MRILQRGLAIPGDALIHDFARSLRMADLSEATRRGYGADLGRLRAWIGGGRGEPVLRWTRASGHQGQEDLARLSPLLPAHVIPTAATTYQSANTGVNIAFNTLE
jgi:hypothetical protein